MNSNTVYIVGAGGHAGVVLDAICEAGLKHNVVAALDDDETAGSRLLLEKLPIIQIDKVIDDLLDRNIVPREEHIATIQTLDFYIAIGSNSVRKHLANRFMKLQNKYVVVFPSFVHPSASVSQFARIGEGAFIGNRAICEANVQIGKFALINTAAVVTHDCKIGDFVHVAPGSVLCGRVRVGRGTLIGANCTVLPGVSIGSDCTIGAGTVVTRDVPDGATVRGEPGRIRI